jgi:Golgi phosphoprotein 3
MTGLPPLTILEEFLLLALDDETGDFYELARSTLDCATAGAILMDLMLHRRIDNDLRDMFVTDTLPTGDDILDPVLQIMTLAPVMTPRPIAKWLRELMDESEALREKALRRLEARGIIRREDRKILWVFGARRYPVIHDKEVREVKLRILGVILGDDIPTPHDIMLTALAEACDMFRYLLSGPQLAQAAPRIAQVARMDLIGQSVAKAVTEIEAAIAMASGFR